MKKHEDVIYSEERKQLIEANTGMAQMLKLFIKDFHITKMKMGKDGKQEGNKKFQQAHGNYKRIKLKARMSG